MENVCPTGLKSKLGNMKSAKDKEGSDSQLTPKSHNLSLSSFECGEFIADGSTSTVVDARTVRFTTARENILDKKVVLKCIPKYRVTQRTRKSLHREIEVHLRVGSHPNISTLYASFEDKDGIYLAIEKIRGPTLHELIRKCGTLSERFALQITDQILEGLSFLHSKGYAHRDLSSKNIMFREWPSPESGKLHVMLIDMGDASFRHPSAIGNERCSSEKVGTLLFTAPEVHNDPVYLPESCDMWSIGILMHLMISGKYPYKAKTHPEMIDVIHQSHLILDGEFWDKITPRTRTIIRDLLLPMPSMRPSVEKLKENVEAAMKGKFKQEMSASESAVM